VSDVHSEYATDGLPPAEMLRRAADRLRGFIADLDDCRGPWRVSSNQRGYPQWVTNVGVPYDVCQTHTGPLRPPVFAQFIATMHPGVALALIGVLEAWARVAEAGGDLEGRVGGLEALAVAREVLRAEQWTRWPRDES
jgi:hypothetical protein